MRSMKISLLRYVRGRSLREIKNFGKELVFGVFKVLLFYECI